VREKKDSVRCGTGEGTEDSGVVSLAAHEVREPNGTGGPAGRTRRTARGPEHQARRPRARGATRGSLLGVWRQRAGTYVLGNGPTRREMIARLDCSPSWRTTIKAHGPSLPLDDRHHGDARTRLVCVRELRFTHPTRRQERQDELGSVPSPQTGLRCASNTLLL